MEGGVKMRSPTEGTTCCPQCGQCETWVFCEVVEAEGNEDYNKTIYACNNKECELELVHFYWREPNAVDSINDSDTP